MVSAWASANQVVLGQVKVDDKSNKITAIPALLRMLAILGCIVTVDSMGCQVEIAQTCVDQEADYVLALKENQLHLYEDVVHLSADLEASQMRAYPYDYAESFDSTHGRAEKRQCWTIDDPVVVQQLRGAKRWAKLTCVARVRREYREGQEKNREDLYFLASLPGRAKPMLWAVRSAWSVENNLHWVLDIAFREDDSRVHNDNVLQNFTVLRHIALNLLKQEKNLPALHQGQTLTSRMEFRLPRKNPGWFAFPGLTCLNIKCVYPKQ